jgi:hypothetical protein
MDNLLYIIAQKQMSAIIFNTMGITMKTVQIKKGTNIIDVNDFSQGLYILKANNVNYKLIKK